MGSAALKFCDGGADDAAPPFLMLRDIARAVAVKSEIDQQLLRQRQARPLDPGLTIARTRLVWLIDQIRPDVSLHRIAHFMGITDHTSARYYLDREEGVLAGPDGEEELAWLNDCRAGLRYPPSALRVRSPRVIPRSLRVYRELRLYGDTRHAA